MPEEDVDARLDALWFDLYDATERLVDAARALGRDAEAVKRLVDNVIENGLALAAPDAITEWLEAAEDHQAFLRALAVRRAMTGVVLPST